MDNSPGIFYQIFVRSFADANQDGIGDLQGIAHKLEYLAYLGVEAVWLSPIFPSPSYHKYDVTDYYAIDKEYGTLEDFEQLINKANELGIKIILDLVVSHTSRLHPWFVEALKDENSQYRDYYIWKSKQVIKNLGLTKREISPDTAITNPWHEVKGSDQNYYGIFSDGMPDLNLENQQVRIAILEISRFWMRKGVYGFRLDAARHIYPAWYPVEKNIDFWEALREELETEFGEVYLVGEVWSAPEKVAPYFRGLKANFNFELCYDIRSVLSNEKDETDIIKKLAEAHEIYSKVNPDFVDAIFLGNHDQDRIASVFKNQSAKLQAAINLLMLLPGQPYLYYGEELGAEGKKPDEFLREAFIWNYHENDYYRAKTQEGKYGNEKRLTPLSIQSANPNSVFSHYKKMIAFRKAHPALAQVTPINLLLSYIEDDELISFIRPSEEQNLLIIQNISRFEKTVKAEEGDLLLSTHESGLKVDKWVLNPFGLLVISLSSKVDESEISS